MSSVADAGWNFLGLELKVIIIVAVIVAVVIVVCSVIVYRRNGKWGLVEYIESVFRKDGKNTAKTIGKMGEGLTYDKLISAGFTKDHVFRNVYLKDEKGKLTEIDLVAVGRKGVYVFESKNHSGTIYGDVKWAKWTYYFGNKKYQQPNPTRQNWWHKKVLEYTFKKLPNVKYISVVVFSERCTLKVEGANYDNIVVKRDKMVEVLRESARRQKAVMSDAEMTEICRVLKGAERPGEKVKGQHLQDAKGW